MANTIPARAPHTQALESFLASQTGQLVGDGEKPSGGGWQGAPGQSQFVQYYVVHSIPGGAFDGPLGDPHADSDLIWQVDSYAATQINAEIGGDVARRLLLVKGLPALSIADRAVRWITEDIPGGGARQDPDQPSTFRQLCRYRIATTPSTT